MKKDLATVTEEKRAVVAKDLVAAEEPVALKEDAR